MNDFFKYKYSALVQLQKKFSLLVVVTISAIFSLPSCSDDTEIIDHTSFDVLFSSINDTVKVLYSQNFAEGNFENWSNAEAWSVTTNGAYLKEETTSYLTNFYSLDHRSCHILFTPSNDSKFSVGFNNDSLIYNSNFWPVVIDAQEQKVTCNEETYDFELSPDNSYLLEITKSDEYTYVCITNMNRTNAKIEFKPVLHETNDFYGIRNLAGKSAVFKKIEIRTMKNPYVIFFGDSITFGAGSTTKKGQHVNSFAYLAGKMTGKPFLISGRGGSTIHELLGKYWYKGRIETELKILKPKYAVITIGTNGENTLENLTELVNRVKDAGVIPIVNNIPCKSEYKENQWVNTNARENNKIDSIRKATGVNGARFHMATCLYDNGVTQNKYLFVTEGSGVDLVRVHPNNDGHKELARQLLEDCPELFSN